MVLTYVLTRVVKMFILFQAGDIDGRWEHDMYDGVGGRSRAANFPSFGGGSAKLLVSNLDFGVSDSDVTVCMP